MRAVISNGDFEEYWRFHLEREHQRLHPGTTQGQYTLAALPASLQTSCTHLSMTNVFALLRLLPMSSRDKDAEILALRHQLLVLQRQLGPERVRFAPGSVIGYLRHHPDEHVYFVSNNVTDFDFGDGSSYPAIMLRDLGDMEDRLTLLTSFEDAIARFTKSTGLAVRGEPVGCPGFPAAGGGGCAGAGSRRPSLRSWRGRLQAGRGHAVGQVGCRPRGA